MSGQALNRGGVRVEFNVDVDKPAFRWSVRMRNHEGRGATAEAAFDDLIAQIGAEGVAAITARDTYLAATNPPLSDTPKEPTP